ncbi:baculoviral IAP repeat-containing protein 8-like [Watersipora subatra]|uniref:baculoviral IAP repeat-containing protein 8-like n=1 Tax=Watersipora subatra TaxID=2589382 RepID=UPI00355C049E
MRSNQSTCLKKLKASQIDGSQEDMIYESARLKTFLASNTLSAKESSLLANEGIYLTADANCHEIFKCAFCHFSSSQTNSEQLISLHRRIAPLCPKERNNIANARKNKPDIYGATHFGMEIDYSYNQLGIHEEKPESPEMAVFERRLETFLTFPHPELDVKKLVEAGYYYQGGEGVVCFWCNSTSANWNAGENFWVRHARTSPKCRFLYLQKGQEFIDRAIEEHGVFPTLLPDSTMTVSTRMLRPRMHANCVQTALALGVDRESITTVVRNRIKKKMNDFTSAADIVREITALAEASGTAETAELHLPQVLQPASLTTEDAENANAAEGAKANTEVKDTKEALEEVAMSLKEANGQHNSKEVKDEESKAEELPNEPPSKISIEEIQSMALKTKNQLMCKICMVEVAGIISLPCAHLLSCISCSAALSQCALCRADIKGTIRVHLPQG